MPFNTGDIVMSSEDSQVPTHRMYIVDDIIDSEEGPEYTCFVMSSNISKANLNNKKYPGNILIKNYGSTISKGSTPPKDIIIKIDYPITIHHDEISDTNARKGVVNDLFKKFISAVYLKYQNGLDTSKDYWDDGVPVIRK